MSLIDTCDDCHGVANHTKTYMIHMRQVLLLTRPDCFCYGLF
jgi:hypothetical protein